MFFGIIAALLVAFPAFATPGPISAKRAEAQRVLAEISQLDESLGRANERLNLANIKLDAVQAQPEPAVTETVPEPTAAGTEIVFGAFIAA